MRKILLYYIFIFLSINSYGQKSTFTDLDEALAVPEAVHYLNLTRCTKYCDSIVLLAKLKECKNLHKLSLIRQKYLDLPRLFTLLSELPKLDSLEIEASGITVIPKEVGLLSNLKYLKLALYDGNNRGESILIPDEIGNLVNLQKLECSECNITNLPYNIGNLSNLEELCIYNFWNSGLTILALPESIGKLQKLKKLVLSGNNLKKLPPEFFSLKALELLDLSSNELTDLDSNICKLSNLKSLNIGQNLNLKTIPMCLGGLSKLTYLNLASTQVTQLPQSFINHPQIKYITLCNVLINNNLKKEMEWYYKDKINWESSCDDLEGLIFNYKEKYGKEFTKLTFQKDTLIFNYIYSYQEPNKYGYSNSITVKALKSVIKNKKMFTIPDSSIIVNAEFFNDYNIETSYYTGLTGEVQFVNIGKNQFNLIILLNGKFRNRKKSEELINKKLVFEK